MSDYNLERSPRHTVTEDLRKQVIGLYESGVSRTDIQIQTGVSQPTIRKILEKAGYPPSTSNRTEITPEIRQETVNLYNKLHSSLKVAAQIGIAKRTVLNILSEEARGIKGRGDSVSPQLFIKTWQECNDLPEVALTLGMRIQSVYSRARMYREKGVPLKRYVRHADYDWDDLAEFAELFIEDNSE